MFAKALVLVLFFGIMVWIGLYARRKVQNVSDFVLGGRSVGPWLSAFAYGTSYFSGVVFIGYAGQFGWAFGVSAVWIGLFNALIGSLLAWVVLGRRTRIMTRHLSASTMPEFFEKRYGDHPMRLVASIITFIFLVPYSASVYKGLSGLFAIAFHIDYAYCIIGMALLTAFYVVLGGYVATAINDFVQGLIMLFGIVAVIVAVLNGQGGFAEALSRLSQIPSADAPALSGAYASFFGPDPLNLLGVAVLTSLGTWGLPQMLHKFYAIRDERAIKTGAIISTLFALVVAGGSYFNGAFGRLYVADPAAVGGFDGIVPAMLSGRLSDLLMGVVVVLVLSASMSTLSSLLITSSTTFAIDFLGVLTRKKRAEVKDGKATLRLIRVMCGVFVAISVVIALNPNALISSLMSLSWGVLGGAFLAPFLYGLFWKGATAAGVYASFALGVLLPTVNLFIPNSPLSPTNAGSLAMVLSLGLCPLVSCFTRKPDPALVNEAFACYEEIVEVKEKFALPD